MPPTHPATPAPPGTSGPGTADPLGLVGTLVAEKYRIERVVGEGGFGVVYRARHQIWDEPVAVKCFTALANAPVEMRQELHEQFIREGKLLTSLSSRSTGIVQAHDIGNLTTPAGLWLPYMVLEWLDGKPLDAFLGHHAGQPLGPLRDALEVHRLMEGPARALSLAHARGVAHRDIKPANFFVLGDDLSPGALIKVLDFGIAKVMQGHTRNALQATGAQISSFTPSYGAPEQFDRSHGATGPWTDVFQMALVLVELMRGGLPALHGDDFVQLAFASQNSSRRPTPRSHGITTSDAIEAVFQRALAIKVVDRYRDMSEFWAAFAVAVDAVPTTHPPAHSQPLEAASVAAYELVLEFSRAKDAGRPNAFEFSPQTYLLRSAGGGVETAEFPWTSQFLEDLRITRLPGQAPDAMHRIGDTLRTFLAGAGWSYHERAIMAAARDGAPIFLTIRSAAAELYALPWEFVALKATGQLLGSIPGLLIRYEWPEAPAFPDRMPADRRRGRVLLAWSAAGGAVPADKLIAALRAAFKHRPGAFDPRRDVLAHATVGKIDRALDEAARAGTPFDALHILCHGTAIGATYGLALDDEFAAGAAVSVDANQVQRLLAPHAAMLRMVILAACDSGNVGKPGNHLGSVAQMIHRAGLGAVVASRYPLSFDGSVNFAAAFYSALVGEGASLEQAFLAARDALLCDPSESDWASLQLYSREGEGHATRPLRLAEPTRSRPAVPPAKPPLAPSPGHTTLPTPPRGGLRRKFLTPMISIAVIAALGFAGVFVLPAYLGGDTTDPGARSVAKQLDVIPQSPPDPPPVTTTLDLDVTPGPAPPSEPGPSVATDPGGSSPLVIPQPPLPDRPVPGTPNDKPAPLGKKKGGSPTPVDRAPPPDNQPMSPKTAFAIQSKLQDADPGSLAACNSSSAVELTVEVCLKPPGSIGKVQVQSAGSAIDRRCLVGVLQNALRSVKVGQTETGCDKDFKVRVPSL